MERRALTLTAIVKAFPLNYDEGYGNIVVAKKVHRGNGETYLFASRQSIRYSIAEWCFESANWRRAVLREAGEGNKKVIQLDPTPLEKKEYYFEEADLFGYMITAEKTRTRSAVARLTHLISLEAYYGDQEFLNNKGFADRLTSQKRQASRESSSDDKSSNDVKAVDPNLANIETGYGYYKYTLAVDLDRVGEDENFDIHLDKAEKIKRVKDLLEAIKFLYRDIKGRREDLHPLFVIGGVYPIKSLFFHNAVNIYWRGSKAYINRESIEQVLGVIILDKESEYSANRTVRDYTRIGIQKGEFGNEEGWNQSPFEAIEALKEDVEKAFNDGHDS